MFLNRFAIALACAALAAAQQPPPKNQDRRDLKIETVEPPTPPRGFAVPRSYAVIIGISHYQNLPANLQLQFTERDAQALHTVLISPEGGNFKEQNVHLLNGSKATLANIRRELNQWLPSVAKDDDRVVVYFAGHGFIDKGKAYLAPYDVNRENLSGTAYPMDELGSVIGGKVRAKWKVLLTDACHSGAITPDETQVLNQTLNGLTPSLFSLTASRDRESSYETPDIQGGHGVFTYFVVKGLEGEADASRDGIVTAEELAEYVNREVRRTTEGRQNPTSDRGRFDPLMQLAYIPSRANPDTAPPPATGTLIFESNMDGVEVFVDGNSIGVLSKGKAVPVPGLMPGQHTVKGVRAGFEPDGPRQETVYPGTETTVSIRITIQRHRPKAAVDLLDDGNKLYLKGEESNYKKAIEKFEQALKLDPTYSQVAYYLARSYNAIYDQEKAEQYFKKAIEIDPDYIEARANYAGMLLDKSNTDEAIRQINAVLVRDPKNVEAQTHLAQAMRLKGDYPRAIDAAREAIAIAPRNAEPHLWLADSLRLSDKYAESEMEYQRYLVLSDFNSKLGGQINYYVLGSLFGMGKKKRAAERDIWRELRSFAYYGLCDSEYRLKRFDNAIPYCQKSLSYYSDDALAHYSLGMAYLHRADQTGSYADLDPALKHLQASVTINPDLPEADFARKNIKTIQQAMKAR